MSNETANEQSKYPLHEELARLEADERQKHDDYWQISRVDQKVANTEAEKDYWTKREGETWHEYEDAQEKRSDFERDNADGLKTEDEDRKAEQERTAIDEKGKANEVEKSL